MSTAILDPTPTIGWTKSSNPDLAATVTAVATTRAAIGKIHISNNSGATAFIQVFDAAASSAVTLGTTEPDLQYVVAAATHVDDNFPTAGGSFLKGIQIASTTLADGMVGSAAEVDVTVFYR